MNSDKHLTYYIVLFSGLIIFILLFLLFRYNSTVQIIVGALGSCFYIVWGIIHHVLEGRLTRQVALEYVLFGGLAFVLLLTALNL